MELGVKKNESEKEKRKKKKSEYFEANNSYEQFLKKQYHLRIFSMKERTRGIMFNLHIFLLFRI